MKLRDLRTQFGSKPTEADLARYRQSPNWVQGSFRNLQATPMAGSLREMPAMIYKQLTGRKGRVPERPLPLHFDPATLNHDRDGATKMAWFGHSALLFRIAGKTILVDPMLGPDTTPIAPFPTKRFSENTLDLIDQFPPIDLILITHDHYDHLDLASIRLLKDKTSAFAVALGVKRHLVKWGVDPERVTEFDWWDTENFGGVDITFTPTRHFAGRGLGDRNTSLWGGWVLAAANEKIWVSGDGGYGQHFTEIGRRHGPFDFAFLECGQYNVDWPLLHMFPHESIQAALDAGAQKVIPIHCAGFCLTYQHRWAEPLEAFQQAAAERQLPCLLPPLGRVFTRSDSLPHAWWRPYNTIT